MIRFRKDRSVYVVDALINGRRVRRQAKTLEDAQAIESQMLEKTSGRFKFVDACLEYMETHSKRKESCESEKHFFYLLDIFLHQKEITYLDEIKPRHLESLQMWLMENHEFYSARVQKHRAIKPSSVNRYFSSFGSFFNWCVKNEMIVANPCAAVKKLNIEKPDIPLLTDQEFNLFYDNCKEWFRPIAMFVYLTGMRPSSIERLKWKHINFENSFIQYESLKGSQGKISVKYFPLVMPELKNLLSEYRQGLIAKGLYVTQESFVFAGHGGLPISAESISKVANKVLKRLGMKPRLYSLRHKLVTDLINAGVGIEITAQIVGHTNLNTTRNYSHGQSMDRLGSSLELVRGKASFGAEMAQKMEGVS